MKSWRKRNWNFNSFKNDNRGKIKRKENEFKEGERIYEVMFVLCCLFQWYATIKITYSIKIVFTTWPFSFHNPAAMVFLYVAPVILLNI